MNIKYVAFIGSNGEIKSMRFARASNNPAEGYNADHDATIVHITEDINGLDQYMRTHVYRDGSFVTRTEKPNPVATWDGTAWTWTVEDMTELVRGRRLGELNASDWTQLPDSPLTDAKKAEWANYRQALRDVTTQVDANTSAVSDITWPTKPE